MELENVAAEIEVEMQESGPPGEQGPPGLSAYEVYLVNGGTLSEKEWLESLKGEPGPPGAILVPLITIQRIAGPGTNGSSPTTWFSDTEVCEALSKHVNDSIGTAIKPANVVYGNNLEYYSAFHSLSNTVVKSGTNNYRMTSYVTNNTDPATVLNTNGINVRALSTLFIQGEWVDDVYTCTSYSIYRRTMSFIDGYYVADKTLTKTNTTEYTPTKDYHPATKKYVDDNSGGPIKTFEITMDMDTTSTNVIYHETIDDSVRTVLNELVSYAKNTGSDFKLVVHNTSTKSNASPSVELYMRSKFNEASDKIILYSSYYYGQKYYETSLDINFDDTTGLLLENDSDTILQVHTFQHDYLTEDTYNVYPTGTYYFNKKLPQSSLVPTSDVHLVNKKYVDDSVANIDIGGEALPILDFSDKYLINFFTSNVSVDDDMRTRISKLINDYKSKHAPDASNINDCSLAFHLIVNTNGCIGATFYQNIGSSSSTGSPIYFNAIIPSISGSSNYYSLIALSMKITGTWTDGVFTCDNTSLVNGNSYKSLNIATTMNTDANETISRQHTYTTLPVSSVAPTSDTQFVNKKYVDDSITSAITTVLEGEY